MLRELWMKKGELSRVKCKGKRRKIILQRQLRVAYSLPVSSCTLYTLTSAVALV